MTKIDEVLTVQLFEGDPGAIKSTNNIVISVIGICSVSGQLQLKGKEKFAYKAKRLFRLLVQPVSRPASEPNILHIRDKLPLNDLFCNVCKAVLTNQQQEHEQQPIHIV